MKAGQFNIDEYLERLYEEAGEDVKNEGQMSDNEGIIIPDENKKSYNWLKKEYQKGQTEVKVEISMGGAKFEPGYDLQTNLDSVKDFKPGMFGEVKTKENPNPKKPSSLETSKEKESFGKDEGEAKKKELPGKEDKEGKSFPSKEGKEKTESPKTNSPKGDIKNKEEGKGHEEKESKEHEEGEKEEKKESGEKPEVKKIDLKTKKK